MVAKENLKIVMWWLKSGNKASPKALSAVIMPRLSDLCRIFRMQKKIITKIMSFLSVVFLVSPLAAADDHDSNQALLLEIKHLQAQTAALQKQLIVMQKQVTLNAHNTAPRRVRKSKPAPTHAPQSLTRPVTRRSEPQPAHPPIDAHVPGHAPFHSSLVSVHIPEQITTPPRYYPVALVADNKIVTYIAGTPVVTSPYTGERPAFDGSDYIVNISSINRDIRLMEQRRRFYNAYKDIGYPPPRVPIIALSGKSEPVAVLNNSYNRDVNGDISLGSSELDVAAALNHYVEAFFSIAYDDSPPANGGPRVNNSAFNLNLGFVNIGDLDKTPFYFTAGQLFVPFGRYSSSMISSPLSLTLARTKTRSFIVGYKSQNETGPYAAAYTYVSETDLNSSTIGGFNLGYTFGGSTFSGDIGAGYIGTIADAAGMQLTGSRPYTTFGGFASLTNGSEAVGKAPAVDIHGNISFSRYSLTAEWVSVTKPFSPLDLSFNGYGAKPQALQLEAGVTFRAFGKPASLAGSYQWTRDALALNLPEQRLSGVFNISIWKDTIESLEYRHDMDYGTYQFANGAAPPGVVNANTIGSGHTSDALIAQIGVYF